MIALVTCATIGAACTTVPNKEAANFSWPADAGAAFQQLEQRLLAADAVSIDAWVEAAGAIGATLEVSVQSQPGNLADIQAIGQFGPRDFEVTLNSDGKLMRYGAVDRSREEDTPARLHESLVLGATRMGVLHNIARLVSATPPDGADGAFADAVKATDFSWAGEEQIDDRAARGLSFQIRVFGAPTAEVILWLDQVTGLPLSRSQTVHFGHGGDMQVVERYSRVTLDGSAPSVARAEDE